MPLPDEVRGRLDSLRRLEYRNPVNGRIVSETPTSPIPEPAVYLQLPQGLGATAAVRKRLAKG